MAREAIGAAAQLIRLVGAVGCAIAQPWLGHTATIATAELRAWCAAWGAVAFIRAVGTVIGTVTADLHGHAATRGTAKLVLGITPCRSHTVAATMQHQSWGTGALSAPPHCAAQVRTAVTSAWVCRLGGRPPLHGQQSTQVRPPCLQGSHVGATKLMGAQNALFGPVQDEELFSKHGQAIGLNIGQHHFPAQLHFRL